MASSVARLMLSEILPLAPEALGCAVGVSGRADTSFDGGEEALRQRLND